MKFPLLFLLTFPRPLMFNHVSLIHQLSYYGVQGTALTIFQSYLSNRKRHVKFDNVESDLATLTTGVQGSILGPLLLLIYMHD